MDENKATRDTSLDLRGALENANSNKEKAELSYPHMDVNHANYDTVPEAFAPKKVTPSLRDLITSTVEVPDTVEEEEEDISPLDKAIKAKNEQTDQNGIIGDVEEEEEGIRPLSDSDERRQDVEERLSELDNNIDAARAVLVIRKPATAQERAEFMDDLSLVKVDQTTGQATFVPESKYIIAKTPEIMARLDRERNGETTDEDYNNPMPVGDYANGNEVLKTLRPELEKDKVVKILIDKTGLGPDIVFDEEEKKAIKESTLIHLVEVEDQELKTMEMEATDDDLSFLENVNKYSLSISKTPMIFPTSGFKADMTGLSFGEFSDIVIDTRNNASDIISFEKMNRKFYVIYTHMINVSCGEFESYEDFLKKFSFNDSDIATYGLCITTQPEIDEVSLRCNKNRGGCGESFVHKYSPRTMIDFETADIEFLKQMDKLNEADPTKYKELAKTSPVRTIKRIELPISKARVDFKIISCWDYLYKYIPFLREVELELDKIPDEDENMDEAEKMKNNEKVNKLNKLIDSSPLLLGISAVHILGPNGKYHSFRTGRGILEALIALPTNDNRVVTAGYGEYISKFGIGFSLKKVKCTKCGHDLGDLALSPDELVFLIARQSTNTMISFDNFRSF